MSQNALTLATAAFLLVFAVQCRKEPETPISEKVPEKPMTPKTAPVAEKTAFSAPASAEEFLALFPPQTSQRSQHRAMRSLESVPLEHIAAWWHALSQMKQTEQHNLSAAQALLAAIWAEKAPHEALAWTQANPEAAQAGVLMERLTAQAATTGNISPEPHAKLRDAWIRGTIIALLGKSAEQAWQWAESQPNEITRKEAQIKILRRLATSDPALAARRFDQLASTDEKLRTDIVQNWVMTDPTAAWDWLQKASGEPQKKLQAAYFLRLSETDPQAAIARISAMEDGELRNNLTKTVGTAIAQHHPAIGTAFLDGPSRKDGAFGPLNKAMQDALANWMATDAPAAFSWMRQAGKLGFGATVQGSRKLLDELGPEAALAFYQQVTKDEVPNSIDSNLFIHWAQSDPQGFRTMLEQNPDLRKSTSNEALGIGAAALATQDPTAAIDWVLGADLDGHAKSYPLHSVLSTLARNDPETGAQTITKLLSRPEITTKEQDETSPHAKQVLLTNQTIEGAAASLAAVSPEKATTWAASLPAGSIRDAARLGTAKTLIKLDPIAASEILAQVPSSEARNDAVNQLIQRIEQVDPQAAAQWKAALVPVEEME